MTAVPLLGHEDNMSDVVVIHWTQDNTSQERPDPVAILFDFDDDGVRKMKDSDIWDLIQFEAYGALRLSNVVHFRAVESIFRENGKITCDRVWPCAEETSCSDDICDFNLHLWGCVRQFFQFEEGVQQIDFGDFFTRTFDQVDRIKSHLYETSNCVRFDKFNSASDFFFSDDTLFSNYFKCFGNWSVSATSFGLEPTTVTSQLYDGIFARVSRGAMCKRASPAGFCFIDMKDIVVDGNPVAPNLRPWKMVLVVNDPAAIKILNAHDVFSDTVPPPSGLVQLKVKVSLEGVYENFADHRLSCVVTVSLKSTFKNLAATIQMRVKDDHSELFESGDDNVTFFQHEFEDGEGIWQQLQTQLQEENDAEINVYIFHETYTFKFHCIVPEASAAPLRRGNRIEGTEVEDGGGECHYEDNVAVPGTARAPNRRRADTARDIPSVFPAQAYHATCLLQIVLSNLFPDLITKSFCKPPLHNEDVGTKLMDMDLALREKVHEIASQRFPDGVVCITFVPEILTLQNQTEKRLQDNHTALLEWGCCKVESAVIKYSRQNASHRTEHADEKKFIDFLKIVQADENRRKLFVIIADECHYGIGKSNDSSSAGAQDYYINNSELNALANVIVVAVSATPFNVATKDSRIPLCNRVCWNDDIRGNTEASNAATTEKVYVGIHHLMDSLSHAFPGAHHIRRDFHFTALHLFTQEYLKDFPERACVADDVLAIDYAVAIATVELMKLDTPYNAIPQKVLEAVNAVVDEPKQPLEIKTAWRIYQIFTKYGGINTIFRKYCVDACWEQPLIFSFLLLATVISCLAM